MDYGNEVEAGQGVAGTIKEGFVKREDLFIVSNLWNNFHERERVEPTCRRQLKDRGLDYFDLYIKHFPVALKYMDPAVRYPPEWFNDGATPANIITSNATIQETWEAMEDLVAKGLAYCIGISNFNVALILDLLRYAQIRPATLQIEHHPYLVQKPLMDFVQNEVLTVTTYSSFGPTGHTEMDMDNAIKTPHLLEHPVIVAVAKSHGKSPPQVLLRWATQNGVAFIPKSDMPQMAVENLDAKEFDLTEEEIKNINRLDRNLRNLRFNDPLTVRCSVENDGDDEETDEST